MTAIEIVVIVACVLFVAGVVVGVVVKRARNKKKGIPTCCCDCSRCNGCAHCHADQSHSSLGE